jgi:hypothetical protein
LLNAVNRRGRPFKCRVSVQRLSDVFDGGTKVVVLVDPLPEGMS